MTITPTIPTAYTPIIPTIVTTQGQGEYFWPSGLLAQKASTRVPKTPPAFRNWPSGSFGPLDGFSDPLVLVITIMTIIRPKNPKLEIVLTLWKKTLDFLRRIKK